jgi:hypothetical protein
MPQSTTKSPSDAATGSNIPYHHTDILMNLVVACLAPMFLSVTSGDINFARMAAIETVNAYRARDHMDLIAIAQIIGFGLAALGSLSLSMADDISLAMTLRLRGNANALNRSAEQNRRALRKGINDEPMSQPEADPELQAIAEHEFSDDEMIASVIAATMRRGVAQATATPAPDATPTTAQMTAEKRHQAMWAIAMVKESAEITASIHNLPADERKAAAIRAGVLSSTANEFLTGASTPRTIPHGRGTQEPSDTI